MQRAHISHIPQEAGASLYEAARGPTCLRNFHGTRQCLFDPATAWPVLIVA